MSATGPTTLMEAVQHYADLDVCHAFMARIKWPNGEPCCPKCGSVNVGFIATRRMYKCREKACHKQFSVKVGTIFEDSPLGLDKWFVAVWCIANAKNGISSCELARAIGVTQKSAWHMLHRIRHAMHAGGFKKMSGEVESDETFVGGKAKNMHFSRRQERIKGTGGVGKAIVHGLIERGDKRKKNETKEEKANRKRSKVRAQVVADTKKTTLMPIITDNVAVGANVYTDSLRSYEALADLYVHEAVDHAECYVKGAVHTNSMENFWALFKRCINGTYVAVDEPHLQRYVDEEAFRFNERAASDGERFNIVMPGVVGKRLTYKALIGTNTVENLSPNDAPAAGDLPN